MEGCFKILLNQVHEHQGTINQFTGDGIMALFGALLAIENHALNACQAAKAFDKLDYAVRTIDSENSDEILPFVATLMGMKLKGRHAHRIERIEGEALEKFIAKNVRALLMKGSILQPAFVIIEDLHWADSSSIELLENLYRQAENHRLLFINMFRLGYWIGLAN